MLCITGHTTKYLQLQQILSYFWNHTEKMVKFCNSCYLSLSPGNGNVCFDEILKICPFLLVYYIYLKKINQVILLGFKINCLKILYLILSLILYIKVLSWFEPSCLLSITQPLTQTLPPQQWYGWGEYKVKFVVWDQNSVKDETK